MKTIHLLFGMFTLCMLLSACASDSTQQSDAAAPTVPSGKPELFVYVVQYDDLRLREQPGQQSKVGSKLPIGELVSGNGETSAQMDTVELRGIPMTSSYNKVRTNTGKEGWLFGAAIQVLYAGTNMDGPDMSKIQAISRFLSELDPKNLESGKKAWDHVRKIPADKNPSNADATLILLELFMRRMEFEGAFYSMTEGLKWEDADYEAVHGNRFDMNKYPATKQLAASGFRLAYAEGTVFPVYDLQLFQKYFSTRVGPGMKAYLEQSVLEQQLSEMSDNGIVITLEELADRAAFWEKFNRNNPYFPYKEETRGSQSWLTNALVLGANNTPVFNYETNEVTPEFRKMWEYAQQKYPGTTVASRVKSFADLCASEGWKRTDKVEAYMGKLQM